MHTAYLVVNFVTVAANVFSAVCDFVRYEQVAIAMDRAGVPQSWMTTLGVLKAAGALGLLVGLRVPLIGTAASVGLILFFVGAIITHLARATIRSAWQPCFSCWLALAIHARGSTGLSLVTG